jgi:hypothetical protein
MFTLHAALQTMKARREQMQALARSGMARFLFAGCVCGAMAAVAASPLAARTTTANFYCLGKTLQPGAGCNNGVYHNYTSNSIRVDGSPPTGLFFKTQGDIWYGAKDGYGDLDVFVSGLYYAAGTCWNRSIVNTLYVNRCYDSWP